MIIQSPLQKLKGEIACTIAMLNLLTLQYFKKKKILALLFCFIMSHLALKRGQGSQRSQQVHQLFDYASIFDPHHNGPFSVRP